MAVIEGCFR